MFISHDEVNFVYSMQMTSLYGGPIEFLFMVDSKQDPAYHAISRLLAEYKVRELALSF